MKKLRKVLKLYSNGRHVDKNCEHRNLKRLTTLLIGGQPFNLFINSKSFKSGHNRLPHDLKLCWIKLFKPVNNIIQVIPISITKKDSITGNRQNLADTLKRSQRDTNHTTFNSRQTFRAKANEF